MNLKESLKPRLGSNLLVVYQINKGNRFKYKDSIVHSSFNFLPELPWKSGARLFPRSRIRLRRRRKKDRSTHYQCLRHFLGWLRL